jgi:molybdopterin/thiamine biosynthesis adenylyltransferase
VNDYESDKVAKVCNINNVTTSDIDEQLYSRQLLVYGKSAQQMLMNSTVLVVGSGPLTVEILKNVALAGVGQIVIPLSNEEYDSMLKGNEESLKSYVQSLNPYCKVT